MSTKILFFIETLEGGGAEKVLRDLVNNMDRTKFDITVHTVWPCDARQYLNDSIRYRSVYRSRNRFNYLRYRMEAALGLTYRLHIRDDYDIECAYLECGATKIMASSTNKKAKKLAWVHCDLMKMSGNYQKFAENNRKYYEKYDEIICVAEVIREGISEMFGNSCPAVVLHNTVNESEIQKKANEQLPDDLRHTKLTVMTAGSLYPPKNIPRLICAHKEILESGFDHDLWILGDGYDREKIERLIRDNNLDNTVKMFGFQKNPYPYIAKADIVACSSNYEGFSTLVTEALILGKPIVTTRCSGMNELLGDSEYGLITENNDCDFTAGLLKMVSDSEFRESYAKSAVERGNDFSMSRLVSITQEHFISLLDTNDVS